METMAEIHDATTDTTREKTQQPRETTRNIGEARLRQVFLLEMSSRCDG